MTEKQYKRNLEFLRRRGYAVDGPYDKDLPLSATVRIPVVASESGYVPIGVTVLDKGGILKAVAAAMDSLDEYTHTFWLRTQARFDTVADYHHQLRDGLTALRGLAGHLPEAEEEDRGTIARKCHNIIASLVMAGARSTLEEELQTFRGKAVSSAYDIMTEGRRAMEAVLTSEVTGDPQPIVHMACAMLADYIDKMMRKAKAKDLKLQGCTNEVHCTDGVYAATFARLYRDENGSVIAECSDHVPDGTVPETFYGDAIDDAYTFDELADIAACLAAGKYTVVK